jgi:hypothetical protein
MRGGKVFRMAPHARKERGTSIKKYVGEFANFGAHTSRRGY